MKTDKIITDYTASNGGRNLFIPVKINFSYKGKIQAHFSSTFRTM